MVSIIEEEDSWRNQDSCRIPREEDASRRGSCVTAQRARADDGADADNAALLRAVESTVETHAGRRTAPGMA